MPERTPIQIMNTAEFILKLANQRNNEAAAIIKLGSMHHDDVQCLLDETKLLLEGYELIMANLPPRLRK